MTKELNCCGLACPEPVIRCRRMLEEEKPASLRVLVDNTAASENVSRFLGRNGYSVEVRQEGADLWCVSATACGCRVTEPEPAAATLTPGKTLVLITTETFGRGNDELGEKLMGYGLRAMIISNPASLGSLAFISLVDVPHHSHAVLAPT